MEITGRPVQKDRKAILVYVTVADRDEAVRIGREIVARRLAACANIVPEITSIYWWERAIQEDGESLLLLKSRAELADKIRAAVIELHSYDVPAISVLPLRDVNPPYLAWLWQETEEA